MNPTPLEAARKVAELSLRHKYFFANEKDLQAGLHATYVKESAVPCRREVALTKKDIVDFLFDDGVAVEVKIKGSWPLVLRQLLRYAERAEVKALVLVTAKIRLGILPDELRGKPLVVVALWKSFL